MRKLSVMMAIEGRQSAQSITTEEATRRKRKRRSHENGVFPEVQNVHFKILLSCCPVGTDPIVLLCPSLCTYTLPTVCRHEAEWTNDIVRQLLNWQFLPLPLPHRATIKMLHKVKWLLRYDVVICNAIFATNAKTRQTPTTKFTTKLAANFLQ